MEGKRVELMDVLRLSSDVPMLRAACSTIQSAYDLSFEVNEKLAVATL